MEGERYLHLETVISRCKNQRQADFEVQLNNRITLTCDCRSTVKLYTLTRAHGWDFTTAVEMQKYKPAYYIRTLSIRSIIYYGFTTVTSYYGFTTATSYHGYTTATSYFGYTTATSYHKKGGSCEEGPSTSRPNFKRLIF